MPRRHEHVLIAGGGVAALEAVLALRAEIGQHVRLTLLASEREFVYRPVTVAEAFGQGEARSYSLPEIITERDHDRFVWDALERVDAGERTVITASGKAIRYDKLVLAMGARFREWLPGALTFR